MNPDAARRCYQSWRHCHSRWLCCGAAAGLCLLPDHYAYRYGSHQVGTADVVFPCVPHGSVPLPERLPAVVWQAGIDLDPVDVNDPEAVRWLEALVRPEQHDRLERLRKAIMIARREAPRLVRGDLLQVLPRLALEAPPQATLVVFHTAVLAYLSAEERERFQALVRSLPAEWISTEGPDVLPDLPAPEGAPPAGAHLRVSRNGAQVVALCDPHGGWIQWIQTDSDSAVRSPR